MEVEVGNGVIEIIQADIASLEVDAIVNAANNHLFLGSGVAGAIRAGGGPSIQEECNRIGPIKVGEAAITGAGDLPAKFVIHAAAMGDEPVSARSLGDCVRNSLLKGEDAGISSIAFPAIGTGVGGFSMERCAGIMLDLLLEHLRQHLTEEGCGIRRIVLALYGEHDKRVFQDALESRLA